MIQLKIHYQTIHWMHVYGRWKSLLQPIQQKLGTQVEVALGTAKKNIHSKLAPNDETTRPHAIANHATSVAAVAATTESAEPDKESSLSF